MNNMSGAAGIEQLKYIVERAGAEWCGVQETVSPALPLLMFNSKESRSTLAISFDPDDIRIDDLIARIRARLGASNKTFRR